MAMPPFCHMLGTGVSLGCLDSLVEVRHSPLRNFGTFQLPLKSEASVWKLFTSDSAQGCSGMYVSMETKAAVKRSSGGDLLAGMMSAWIVPP